RQSIQMIPSSKPPLTEEQKAKIAANRAKALERLAQNRTMGVAGVNEAAAALSHQPQQPPVVQQAATTVAAPAAAPVTVVQQPPQPTRAASEGEASRPVQPPVPMRTNSGPLTAEQEALRQRNREAALARAAARAAQPEATTAAAAAVPAPTSAHSSFGATTAPAAPTARPTVSPDRPMFLRNIDCEVAVCSPERFKVTPGNLIINDALRCIPTKIWDDRFKAYTFPFSDIHLVYRALSNITQASVRVIRLPDNVVRILQKEDKGGREKSAANPTGDLTSGIDPFLLNSLFPFQKKGVLFGIAKAGRVLIADEMGLGKSIQALAIARYYRANFPLAIVCPSSVKSAWKHQIERFCPAIKENLYMLEKERDPLPGIATSNTVLIMSYNYMSMKQDDLAKAGYGVWIFDESHYLKDFKAKRTKAAQHVSKKSARVIFLSGTPALSRPAELYSQIKIIDPSLFTTQRDFFIRYCDGQDTKYGMQAKGATNSEELSAILQKRLMIRRLKAEVLTDLPQKLREIIYITSDDISSRIKKSRLTSARAFDAGKADFQNDQNLIEYYTHTGTAKARPVCDHIIDNYFYEGADESRKILVFAHHQIVLDTIEHSLSQRGITSIRIDGKTPSATRGDLCQSFQEDPSVRVAVLSITAAGEGITLTAASVVIFAEIYWIPGKMQQAEDRAHRVGQQNSVIVQYMLANNTADDIIWPLVKSKIHILEQVNLNAERYTDAESREIDTDNGDWSIDDNDDDIQPSTFKKRKV
ncbi:hypothetical protein PENTCL1PPCAC_13714, partial [Pristionchus entomophagus]